MPVPLRPAEKNAARPAGGGLVSGGRVLEGYGALRALADAEAGPHGRTWGRWRAVAAALPPAPPRSRRSTDLAAAVAAVANREATGAAWRRLPAAVSGCPNWRTVYGLRERWRRAGALAAVLEAAGGPGAEAAGRPRGAGVRSCGAGRAG